MSDKQSLVCTNEDNATTLERKIAGLHAHSAAYDVPGMPGHEESQRLITDCHNYKSALKEDAAAAAAPQAHIAPHSSDQKRALQLRKDDPVAFDQKFELDSAGVAVPKSGGTRRKTRGRKTRRRKARKSKKRKNKNKKLRKRTKRNRMY
jgi:hypothetical protein